MDTHHVAATTNVSGRLVMAGSSHRRRLPEDPIVSVDSASSSPCRPSQPAGRVRRMSPCVGSTTDKSPLLLSPRNVGHWSIAGAAPPSATTYGHGVRSEPPRSEGRRRRSGGSCLSRLRSDDLTADEQSGLEQVLAGCRHLEVTVAQVTAAAEMLHRRPRRESGACGWLRSPADDLPQLHHLVRGLETDHHGCRTGAGSRLAVPERSKASVDRIRRYPEATPHEVGSWRNVRWLCRRDRCAGVASRRSE